MQPAQDLLRASGLRVTAARVAALEVLAERNHLTTEEICVGVRARIGEVSVQAVYHLLEALTSIGLVRRLEIAGSPARYERRVGDNHHHLVCRSCGAVSDIDCEMAKGPCLVFPNSDGFLVLEAEITFWGVCPPCQVLRDLTLE